MPFSAIISLRDDFTLYMAFIRFHFRRYFLSPLITLLHAITPCHCFRFSFSFHFLLPPICRRRFHVSDATPFRPFRLMPLLIFSFRHFDADYMISFSFRHRRAFIILLMLSMLSIFIFIFMTLRFRFSLFYAI